MRNTSETPEYLLRVLDDYLQMKRGSFAVTAPKCEEDFDDGYGPISTEEEEFNKQVDPLVEDAVRSLASEIFRRDSGTSSDLAEAIHKVRQVEELAENYHAPKQVHFSTHVTIFEMDLGKKYKAVMDDGEQTKSKLQANFKGLAINREIHRQEWIKDIVAKNDHRLSNFMNLYFEKYTADIEILLVHNAMPLPAEEDISDNPSARDLAEYHAVCCKGLFAEVVV